MFTGYMERSVFVHNASNNTHNNDYAGLYMDCTTPKYQNKIFYHRIEMVQETS